jgi:hypothetical protein
LPVPLAGPMVSLLALDCLSCLAYNAVPRDTSVSDLALIDIDSVVTSTANGLAIVLVDSSLDSAVTDQ